MYEKIVVITRKTRLQELVERFNTLGQAKFYIEHAGGDFAEYVAEDDAYRRSLDVVQHALQFDLKTQFVDRGFLPTFMFTENDIVVTLGQDGLVANTAKYVKGQPIVAVNPDPKRFDGVLLPFQPKDLQGALLAVLAAKERKVRVTMAEASFSDGQQLRAFNDLFIGPKSHISARYVLTFEEQKETQSSSGILVSTGAGSTGWLSSVFNMSAGVAKWSGGKAGVPMRMKWDDPRLAFVVREPFRSNHSSANVVAGMIERDGELVVESIMPSGGCVFSDGIESDFVEFNSGAIVHVHPSERGAQLVTK